MTTPPGNTSLNAARRTADLAGLDDPVDLLVVGGGATGAGVALDAASRGLSVVLAEKHDLAFGTSRWSSKLIHGGLRYLASGHVGIAYESAVERDILLRHTAPHLVAPLPQLVPLLPGLSHSAAGLVRAGYLAGDLLRVAARTPSRVLPRSRRLRPAEVARYAPGVKRSGLRGGLVFWDGQLVDDARLVVALARTAAGHGARILTRCAASRLTGHSAILRDTLTGSEYRVRARMVVNATGVWAAGLTDGIALRPSRGTHLVFPAAAFAGLTAGLTVPVPGEANRFVFALPAGRHVYVGLTDVDAGARLPDVPEPDENEIDFLLDTINTALARPLSRADLVGSYAGLRPLLAGGGGRSADMSRKHAVITGPDGLVTVVGGKLTTYRRMAADAVDAALAAAATCRGRRLPLNAGPCRTRRLPLVGAAAPERLDAVDAPLRLVRRYGTEAETVVAAAEGDASLLRPVAPGVDTTAAELRFAVRHEGALDVGDLLDRRTRVGLDPAARAAAVPAAETALGN